MPYYSFPMLLIHISSVICSYILLFFLFPFSVLPYTHHFLQFHDQSLPQDNITNKNKDDLGAGLMKTTDLEGEDWMLDEEPVLTTAARRFKSGESVQS